MNKGLEANTVSPHQEHRLPKPRTMPRSLPWDLTEPRRTNVARGVSVSPHRISGPPRPVRCCGSRRRRKESGHVVRGATDRRRRGGHERPRAASGCGRGRPEAELLARADPLALGKATVRLVAGLAAEPARRARRRRQLCLGHGGGNGRCGVPGSGRRCVRTGPARDVSSYATDTARAEADHLLRWLVPNEHTPSPVPRCRDRGDHHEDQENVLVEDQERIGRKAEEEQGRRLRAAEAERRRRVRAPAQYNLHQIKLSTPSPLHLSLVRARVRDRPPCSR